MSESKYRHGNRVRIIETQTVGVIHMQDFEDEDDDMGFEQRYSVWDPWLGRYVGKKWYFESELEPCQQSVLELFGEPDPERYDAFAKLMVKGHAPQE